MSAVEAELAIVKERVRKLEAAQEESEEERLGKVERELLDLSERVHLLERAEVKKGKGKMQM